MDWFKEVGWNLRTQLTVTSLHLGILFTTAEAVSKILTPILSKTPLAVGALWVLRLFTFAIKYQMINHTWQSPTLSVWDTHQFSNDKLDLRTFLAWSITFSTSYPGDHKEVDITLWSPKSHRCVDNQTQHSMNTLISASLSNKQWPSNTQ